MTPIYNTTMVATTTAFGLNSPILYISCGLVVVLCVIACALLTLACSYKKPSTSIRDEVKPSLLECHGNVSLEKEAKIVIVMPGDINPSYLAKLVPSSTPRLHKV
ncbi:protein GLUTAMINE DUMPER 5 [Artemisia annua]|uniref:Protein GLUTAMINE DUMPER 5 n=1 Tax=Artemisia annua TaxID=35608 RepID=A0A2U1QP41_ARTAN|nr:protein GLUTAMINE DUMPER 5 [Artemisia annua]